MMTNDEIRNKFIVTMNDDNRVKELEKEIERLKVEVEALKPYRDNHHNLIRHMDEHDADVIDNALYGLSDSFRYDFEGGYGLSEVEEFIHNYINQLRQKAQETTK